MADIIEGSTRTPDFRDEAQQCLHLASAEPEGELRTILAGMALGWPQVGRQALSNSATELQTFLVSTTTMLTLG
jgi:hypothetical protein